LYITVYELCIKNFLSGYILRSFKRNVIPMNIVPTNVLLVDIEGHTYIEKDGQIFICHIFEINITNTNNITYIILQKQMF